MARNLLPYNSGSSGADFAPSPREGPFAIVKHVARTRNYEEQWAIANRTESETDKARSERIRMDVLSPRSPNPNRAIRMLNRRTLIIVVALIAAATIDCSLLNPAREPRLTDEERRLNNESFEIAWATVRDRHWDPDLGGNDWQAVHDELSPRVRSAATKRDYIQAFQSMIDRFDQSHFAVLPAKTFEQFQAPTGQGALDGTMGIDLRAIDGKALVTSVEEDSTAAAAGVKPGWEVVKIDGDRIAPLIRKAREAFEGKTMAPLVMSRTAAQRLDGKVGAKKKVRFRDGQGRKKVLEIELVAHEGKKYRLGNFPASYIWIKSERLEGDIGYIAFNGFMDPVNVMPAFERAIKSFMDCQGIVIDIRGNGGGMPGVAMGMAGWLIESDDEFFGTMKLRETDLKFVVNPRLEVYNGPLAILIDGLSGSCAEIFPAGLRDMGRARLFGTRTAGAVLPAQFMKLPNGDFFYYPFADYFSKNGDRLEGVGVVPDVEVDHKREDLLNGRDNALLAAVDWIESQSGR